MAVTARLRHAAHRRTRLLQLRLLDGFLQLANLGDDFLLRLPAQLQVVDFSLTPASSFSSACKRSREAGIVFLAQRLALDFKLRHAALNLVDLGRHGIDLDAQAGGGFVNQVDGFVGQEAVRDVTVESTAAATMAESLMRTLWCSS